jgi:hypothetical protein
VLALGATGAVPLTIDAAPIARARTYAAGAAGRPAWMWRVLATLTGGSAPRATVQTVSRRPLDAIGPVTEDCAISGQVTVTLDDRDGDGDASAGDVATFVFDACRDDATTTVDGGVTATLVSINSDGSSASADLALDRLSATTSLHAWRSTVRCTSR